MVSSFLLSTWLAPPSQARCLPNTGAARFVLNTEAADENQVVTDGCGAPDAPAEHLGYFLSIEVSSNKLVKVDELSWSEIIVCHQLINRQFPMTAF